MTTTLTSDEREEQQQPEQLFVELRTQRAFTVKPEPYVETVEYLRKATVNAHYEDLMRAALLREESAATQMRDKCVEKVKAAIHDLSRTSIAAEQNAREIDVLIKVREELKSLTLDNGEQRFRS